MNGEKPKAYRFATPAQWQAGLLDRIRIGSDGLSPIGRLAQSPVDEYAGEVGAVAVSRRGELFWVGGGRLHSRTPPQDESCVPDPACDVDAPSAIARAARLIAWRKWLWALDRHRTTITRYYAESLQQSESLSLAQLAGAPVQADCTYCDIAPDGDDGLWVLIGSQSRAYHVRAQATRIDSIAVPAGVTRLTTIGDRDRALVLLDPVARKLHFVPPRDVITVALDDVAPGFAPLALGGNGRDRVLLAGNATRLPDDASATFSPAHRLVLVLDASGGLVDYLDLGVPSSPDVDLAGLGDTVWVADAQGLHRFALGAASGNRVANGWFISPLLISPEGRDSGWLRAELVAELPPGAAMRVRYASTDNVSKKEQVVAIAEDKTLPQATRRDGAAGIVERAAALRRRAGRAARLRRGKAAATHLDRAAARRSRQVVVGRGRTARRRAGSRAALTGIAGALPGIVADAPPARDLSQRGQPQHVPAPHRRRARGDHAGSR
jgi:hypothetical protein